MRRVLVRLGGILVLVMVAVWLYCVLDAASADRDRVRALPKGVWVAVVVLTFILGSIAWLLFGRPRGPERPPRLGSSPRTSWPTRPPGRPGAPASGAFRRTGPPAPDDDPEFLARLDREATRDHEKLLGSWEEDLRRREEELRRGAADPDESDGGPDGGSDGGRGGGSGGGRGGSGGGRGGSGGGRDGGRDGGRGGGRGGGSGGAEPGGEAGGTSRPGDQPL